MDYFERLQDIFSHFPGIGPRQARRFVYYLLNKPQSFIKDLTSILEEIKKTSRECKDCHRFFLITSNDHGDLCSICNDKSRDKTILMIIARDFDLESIEKSGVYKGLYFVLGGTVPLLDKEPEKRIRLKAMLEYISTRKFLKEIVLSLNTTPEGEHTENIVRDAIGRISSNIKISELGRGLSTGAEIEYADEETIRNAFGSRK